MQINMGIEYEPCNKYTLEGENGCALCPPPPHRHTNMQWTQKRGQRISQSDPYHYLPCKAHLNGRLAAQTSAIFTHILSCFRSPQLHLVCQALKDSETKSQIAKYSVAPWSPWNHSILSTVPACDFSHCSAYICKGSMFNCIKSHWSCAHWSLCSVVHHMGNNKSLSVKYPQYFLNKEQILLFI